MAMPIVESSSAGYGNGVPSFQFLCDVPVSDNRYLVVAIAATILTDGAVDFNGIPLTLLLTDVGLRLQFWGLLNPPISGGIVTVAGSTVNTVRAISASLSGVDQGTPIADTGMNLNPGLFTVNTPNTRFINDLAGDFPDALQLTLWRMNTSANPITNIIAFAPDMLVSLSSNLPAQAGAILTQKLYVNGQGTRIQVDGTAGAFVFPTIAAIVLNPLLPQLAPIGGRTAQQLQQDLLLMDII